MMKITEIDENIVPEVYIYTDDVGLLKSLVDKLIRKRVNIVWINDKYIWPQKGKGNFKTISDRHRSIWRNNLFRGYFGRSKWFVESFFKKRKCFIFKRTKTAVHC